MADISSLQLLTMVYCYFVATTRLQERRSSITVTRKPLLVAWGGGGRKLGA